MIISKHFITSEVSATGPLSLFFLQQQLAFLCTGMIIELFQIEGTELMSRDFWKMEQQASAGSLLQDFSKHPEMPSGPEVFLGQRCKKSLHSMLINTVFSNSI